MFDEIELLESMVQDHLCKSQRKLNDNASGYFEIANLYQLIKKALVKTVFELKKDRFIIIYIQDVQKRLILLSNRLYLPALKGKQHQFKKNQDLLTLVDNLLVLVCNTFLDYINLEINIPDNQKDKSFVTFKEQLIQIEKLYKGQKNELIEIALYPIRKFIKSNLAITYHQSGYFNYLLHGLSHYQGSLKEYLITLNLNSLSFLHYMIREIVNNLEELESYSEKMERLLWNMKWVKQIHFRFEINKNFIGKSQTFILKASTPDAEYENKDAYFIILTILPN